MMDDVSPDVDERGLKMLILFVCRRFDRGQVDVQTISRH